AHLEKFASPAGSAVGPLGAACAPMPRTLGSAAPGLNRAPKTAALVIALVGLAACGVKPPASPTNVTAPNLAHAYAAAADAEARDPGSARPSLDALDLAVAEPDVPGAVSTTIAVLDALVYRVALGQDDLPSHAIAFRSRELTGEVTQRLGTAWDKAKAGSSAR